MSLLVCTPDGTPVAGATVALSTTNGLTLDLCGNTTGCTVFSNDSGQIVVSVAVNFVGAGLVTAQLAPASYANPSTAITTLLGVSSNLDIALLGQRVKVEQGTSVTIPLVARVLNPNGPQSGVQVNFQLGAGENGVLGAPSVVTDAAGNAATTLRLSPVSGDVEVTACVAPANTPCNQFVVGQVLPSALHVHVVSGSQQVITEGQARIPVTIQVTDDSSPAPFPVFGAPVQFLRVLSRSGTNGPPVIIDDGVVTPVSDPVILGSQTTTVASNLDGTATANLWSAAITAGEQVQGLATVDSGAQAQFSMQILPNSIAAASPASRPALNQTALNIQASNHPHPPVDQFFTSFTSIFTEFPAPELKTNFPADPKDATLPTDGPGKEDPAKEDRQTEDRQTEDRRTKDRRTEDRSRDEQPRGDQPQDIAAPKTQPDQPQPRTTESSGAKLKKRAPGAPRGFPPAQNQAPLGRKPSVTNPCEACAEQTCATQPL